MQINVDLLVAGCNTRCRHCYVDGGPGPRMRTEDALACIRWLDAAAERIRDGVSFTLDHEPMDHPDIARILRAAAGTQHIEYYHHGMTTGAALVRRRDREDVLRAYAESGYGRFGITIHGAARHHDHIVRREGAYDAAVAAGVFFKERGAKLEVSLMLNRFFPEDAGEISRLLERLEPDCVLCVLPIYTPHAHMADFEPYRASLSDIVALRGWMREWGEDGERFLEKAQGLTAGAAASRLREGPALRELFARPQDELYLSLHPDCALYAGNSGAETMRIGDIRGLDPEDAARAIRELPGNRDYGAFYDPEALPSDEALAEALGRVPRDLVYGDPESALYRGLAEMGIPTRILPPAGRGSRAAEGAPGGRDAERDGERAAW